MTPDRTNGLQEDSPHAVLDRAGLPSGTATAWLRSSPKATGDYHRDRRHSPGSGGRAPISSPSSR